MDQGRLSVLHLTAGSDAGGLSRYILDLGRAMHAQGHKIAVAGERGAWHRFFEEAPFPWIDVQLKGGPIALSRAARKLRAYLRENPVDVIHTHYRRATMVGRRIHRTEVTSHKSEDRRQKSAGIPILYTLHLSHISLRWPWRMFSDFGDHTHVASQDARQWLIDDAHVPAEKISLIPHGIALERFPPADSATKIDAKAALGFTPFDRVAVYVGRLDYPKSCDWLIDVAAATRDRVPRLRILLAGEGPDEGLLKRLIAQRNLHDRVFLLGHREPLPIYQAADALLLPSLREGFSLVCAEAMAVGVPVLRTRTSGTSETIVEGITGKSTPINRQAFVTAAVEFLADDEGLRQMSQGAAQLARESFSFTRQLDATMALYRKLAANARPATQVNP
jgi:glycosyltransferase involved in cell wall biosynthesis